VSTLAAAPERAGQEVQTSARPAGSPLLTVDVLLGLGLTAVLVALVFLTSNTIDQTVTASGTWSEIALTFAGAVACAAAVLLSARARAWGAVTAGLFAAFTALTALSILWSVEPDWSWFGANQLLAYLAVFAGAAALGRTFPERWPALVGGVAAATAALSGYALLAKVFPATLAANNTFGRLQEPFGYWNAVGVCAAMGVPACVWAGARRGHGWILRGLTIPGVTLLIAAIVLSYSRSAVLVAVIAGGCWLAFVPLRLRATLVLAIGAVGAVPIVAWAQGNHSVTGDNVASALQDSAGHSFGVVLLVVVLVVTAVGLGVSFAMDRVAISERVRHRMGVVLVALAALVPVAGIAALAESQRGLGGQISHAWTSLTSSSGAPDTSSRLTQLGSSRPMYWHQGLKVGEHALLKGVGELGYGIARLQYTTERFKSDQAHSFLVQTFADLGLIGLAIVLALFVAWVVAAARPLALARVPVRSSALTGAQVLERQGLAALAAVVVAFGIQSALDWTWYFPGVAIPALLCAGWLAGRGPLTAPVGRRAERRRLIDRPGAAAVVTLIVAVAAAGAWMMWQPLRSVDQLTASQNASTNAVAFADARAAADSNPLSYEPLYALSTLYRGIGDSASARAELVKATQLQPHNPSTWELLGALEQQQHNPRRTIAAMDHVLALDHTADPNTTAAAAAIAQAQARLRRR
jgi:hypothetical protein